MKKLKRIIATFLAVLSVFSLTACTGKVLEKFDKNKTQIFVRVFNGGCGTEWIEAVRDEFNQNNDKYEVVLRYSKDLASSIISDIKKNNADADCYFSCDVEFQVGIYNDYFEDLSDVLSMKPDGETGLTVQEKMNNFDEWKTAASKKGEGMYMLPFTDLMSGLVYNHSLFVENGWLKFATSADKTDLSSQGITFNERNSKLYFVSSTTDVNYNVGDVILSRGKDGVFGTYDDGQPQTEAEFDDMVQNITKGNKKAKAFLYNGIYDHYVNNIALGILAQYLGKDMIDSFFNYDTGANTLAMHDGSQKSISITNGYEIYDSEAVYQALTFINKYFNDKLYVDAKSFKTTSYSHTDAQNDFILSYKNETGYPAMLVEGTWWENEARRMFKTVEDDGDTEYGWGKVDYRFMLLPAINGQKGIDGNGNGSALNVSESGAIVVLKSSNREKVAKIKEFIVMTLRDEVLRNFTKTSGIIRPYSYSLSKEEIAEMTPFSQNVWQIYNDKDNIFLVRADLKKWSNPLTFTSEISEVVLPIKDSAIYNTSFIRALRVNNALSKLGYSANEWKEFIRSAQYNGFYTDIVL